MARSICVVDGCRNFIVGQGWCSKHYMRNLRHGSPTARIPGEVVDGRRVCPTCRVDKPLVDWTNGVCKACACERSAAYRAAHPIPAVSRTAASCDECGSEFQSDRRRTKCCSATCSRSRKLRIDRDVSMQRDREIANAATRRWYGDNRDRAYDAKAAYRARKALAHVEKVDRAAVFERDEWVCQLCGEPISKAANPDLSSGG